MRPARHAGRASGLADVTAATTSRTGIELTPARGAGGDSLASSSGARRSRDRLSRTAASGTAAPVKPSRTICRDSITDGRKLARYVT